LPLDEVQDVLGVAPLRPDPDLEAKVDFRLEDLLYLLTGLDADLLDEAAVAADDDLAVVVPLDEDGRSDDRHGTRIPVFARKLLLFDALDIDGRGERQLLFDVSEHFFPDDLGQQEAFGLVRNLVVRVDLLGLGQGFIDQVLKDGQIDTREGGDGDDLREGKEGLVPFDDGEDRVLADDVHFIDEQEEGDLDHPERLDDELVPVPEGLGGVDEEAEQVRGLERRIDEVHHPAVQRVERLVDAGVVDENDLAFLRCLDAQDADARRLRLIRDDGDLLAEERVEEGGFSDVGPTEQGHVSDLDRRFLFFLRSLRLTYSGLPGRVFFHGRLLRRRGLPGCGGRFFILCFHPGISFLSGFS